MAANNEILITGAGIAGLTAALALAQRGFAVTLVEAFERPTEVGAGIQVAPNATRILRALGVLSAFEEKAVAPSSLRLADALTGRLQLDMPIGDDWLGRMGAPYLTAHRAHLHACLYDAVSAHPGVALRTGCRTVSAKEHPDGVAITIQTGDGDTEDLHAPVLIGADGIWSEVRKAVPGAAAPQPTGRIAWRAIGPASAESASVVTAWMAPDSHIVTYPVRNSESLNIVAITAGKGQPGEWAQERDGHQLSRLFSSLRSDVQLPTSERANWTFWPLFAVPGGSAPSSDRVLLIGDAAHGMEPYAAQGAAMAIEDGFAAALSLQRFPDAPARAFADYASLRDERVQRVRKRTDFNRWVYHQRGPGRHARNLFMRSRPAGQFLSDLEWIFDYRMEGA